MTRKIRKSHVKFASHDDFGNHVWFAEVAKPVEKVSLLWQNALLALRFLNAFGVPSLRPGANAAMFDVVDDSSFAFCE